MTQPIKPGSMVRLRSGGPLMMISHLAEVTRDAAEPVRWMCQWHDEQDILHTATFAEAVLIQVDAADPPSGGRC